MTLPEPASDRPPPADLESLELGLFLEAVYQHYGYDFRDYAQASLRRRVALCLQREQVQSISGLQERVLHDPAAMARFLRTMAITVTAMFRDPSFYAAFRHSVVPLLRTQAALRIWLAGCATGEEVYSLAILLQEEGLAERTRLYATDINEEVLQTARRGIFAVHDLRQYTVNYLQAGGTGEFSAYYRVKYDHVRFDPQLVQGVVWAPHNLASDASFNEFQVIWCRNVLIYFNRTLAARIHQLLYDSLAMAGILGLGSKETLSFTPHEGDYATVAGDEKLFQKVR